MWNSTYYSTIWVTSIIKMHVFNFLSIHKQLLSNKTKTKKEFTIFRQGVSSHGKPGKVMEFDSRFWKILKSHRNYKTSSGETALFGSSFKSCTSTQGYWYVKHENRNRFNLFHHILFKLTPNHAWNGLSHPPSLRRYMSLSYQTTCKRSLNF